MENDDHIPNAVILNNVSECLRSFCISDIDECQDSSTHLCDINANCTNKIASYNCSCNDGYRGNGFRCAGKSQSFRHFKVSFYLPTIGGKYDLSIASQYDITYDLSLTHPCFIEVICSDRSALSLLPPFKYPDVSIFMTYKNCIAMAPFVF